MNTNRPHFLPDVIWWGYSPLLNYSTFANEAFLPINGYWLRNPHNHKQQEQAGSFKQECEVTLWLNITAWATLPESSQHSFEGEPLLWDSYIRAILDQDATATLLTVAVCHSSFGKNAIKQNCYTNWDWDPVFLGQHSKETSHQLISSPCTGQGKNTRICQQLSTVEVRSSATEHTQNVIQ